jgi:hypothetical protein
MFWPCDTGDASDSSRRGGVALSARLSVLAALALGAAACAGSPPAGGTDGAAACAPSTGTGASPDSIADAAALVNRLLAQGRPEVTIPCFVESLARPLGVLAVNSLFSAQPADGPRNPRVFLFSGNLVLSVAPAGPAADLLELAEYVSPVRSIKAEIAFPRRTPVSPTEPYDRIGAAGGTLCGGCHRNETATAGIDGIHAYVSDVLRPATNDEVPLSSVEAEAAACNPAAEPARCALFNAVLDHGAVERRAFSPDAATIYD